MKLPAKNLINAAGTLTSLGGCRTSSEVMEAMAKVASQFIPLAEMHTLAGEHLAKILDVEAAMVTSGAAAGLTLATAACLAGDDPKLASQLPMPPTKHRVIIQCCHRNPFERAIILAGASLLQIGDAIQTRGFDLESALDDSVAAVVFFLQGEMLDASLGLSETLEIAHRYAIPVIVDAAAELPPKENLWKLAQMGADLVIFSGSKDLRGPQTSGLMVGRADLIHQALAQTAPYEHVIGRPLKTGKEIVAGLIKAVEMYLEEDESARFSRWHEIAKYLAEQSNAMDPLSARIFTPTQPYIQPACIPRVGLTFEPCSEHALSKWKHALWKGKPPIAVEVVRDEIWLNPHTLTMEEAEIIVQRIRSIIRETNQ